MGNLHTYTTYIPGVIGKITSLHGEYYQTYWQMGINFEAQVATELAEFLTRFDASHDGLWLAMHEKEIVGSAIIDGREAETQGARLRWVIVAPDHHGQGHGHRLMQAAMDFCAAKGFKRIYLTTFAGLDAARHLYEKWGFRLLQETEGNMWGKNTYEQVFEKDG